MSRGENPVGYLGMKSPEEADGLHWFICIDSASLWDWVTPSVSQSMPCTVCTCSALKMKLTVKIRRYFNSNMGRKMGGHGHIGPPQAKKSGAQAPPAPRFRRLCTKVVFLGCVHIAMRLELVIWTLSTQTPKAKRLLLTIRSCTRHCTAAPRSCNKFPSKLNM